MAISLEIDLPFLSKYFHLPINDVAKEIGVCATVLKKICRKNGIPRWPHRKIKSIDKMISNLENTTPKNQEVDSRIKEEIETLKKKKAYLIKNPNILALKSSAKQREDEIMFQRINEHQFELEMSPPTRSGSSSPQQPIIQHHQQQMQQQYQQRQPYVKSSHDNLSNSVPNSPSHFNQHYPHPPQQYHNISPYHHQQPQPNHHQMHQHYNPMPSPHSYEYGYSHHQPQQHQQYNNKYQQQPQYNHIGNGSDANWRHHQDSPFQTLKQTEIISSHPSASYEIIDQEHGSVAQPQQQHSSQSSQSSQSSSNNIDSQGCYSIQLPRLLIPSEMNDNARTGSGPASPLKTLEPNPVDIVIPPISLSPQSTIQPLPSWFKKEQETSLSSMKLKSIMNSNEPRSLYHPYQQPSPSISISRRSPSPPRSSSVIRVDQLICASGEDAPRVPSASHSSLYVDC